MSSPPIGKGYYLITFQDDEARELILKKRAWKNDLGTIGLQRWTPNFNPYKAKSHIVPVWVRIFEIRVEYFCEPIIETIASVLGHVIDMDERTKNRTMLHYARVLIEINLR